MERKTSEYTTIRRMDQRLRTSNRTVPIATRHPANHEVPASPQNGTQKLVRSMRIASNHQWLHNCGNIVSMQCNRVTTADRISRGIIEVTSTPQERTHRPLPQQQKGRVPFKEPPHAASSTTQDTRQGGQKDGAMGEDSREVPSASATAAHGRISDVTTGTRRTVWLIHPSGMGRQPNDLLMTAE
jgi:hypothetical protein